LSMRTLGAVRDNPGRKAFYEPLRAAGQGAQVALTACMRKVLTLLPALVKHQTPWPPQEKAIDERRSPLTIETGAPLLRRSRFRQQLKAGVRCRRCGRVYSEWEALVFYALN
jgi:hypothetical protein